MKILEGHTNDPEVADKIKAFLNLNGWANRVSSFTNREEYSDTGILFVAYETEDELIQKERGR